MDGQLQRYSCIGGMLTDETASYIIPNKDVTQHPQGGEELYPLVVPVQPN